MITAAVMRARCVFCPRRFGVCEICFGDLLLLFFFLICILLVNKLLLF